MFYDILALTVASRVRYEVSVLSHPPPIQPPIVPEHAYVAKVLKQQWFRIATTITTTVNEQIVLGLLWCLRQNVSVPRSQSCQVLSVTPAMAFQLSISPCRRKRSQLDGVQWNRLFMHLLESLRYRQRKIHPPLSSQPFAIGWPCTDKAEENCTNHLVIISNSYIRLINPLSFVSESHVLGRLLTLNGNVQGGIHQTPEIFQKRECH